MPVSKLVTTLKIKEGTRVLAIDAPNNYEEVLGELPAGAKVTYQFGDSNDFIHLFVRTQEDLAEVIPMIMPTLVKGGLLWVSYPKATSKLRADLTRDHGWEPIHKLKIRIFNIVSFDENWTSLGIINLPRSEPSKASREYVELQKIWTDPINKVVKVPESLRKELDRNPKAAAVFFNHSFACQKEYVLWIVSAKREETIEKRVNQAIEKLIAGKRNPYMS